MITDNSKTAYPIISLYIFRFVTAMMWFTSCLLLLSSDILYTKFFWLQEVGVKKKQYSAICDKIKPCYSIHYIPNASMHL